MLGITTWLSIDLEFPIPLRGFESSVWIFRRKKSSKAFSFVRSRSIGSISQTFIFNHNTNCPKAYSDCVILIASCQSPFTMNRQSNQLKRRNIGSSARRNSVAIAPLSRLVVALAASSLMTRTAHSFPVFMPASVGGLVPTNYVQDAPQRRQAPTPSKDRQNAAGGVGVPSIEDRMNDMLRMFGPTELRPDVDEAAAVASVATPAPPELQTASTTTTTRRQSTTTAPAIPARKPTTAPERTTPPNVYDVQTIQDYKKIVADSQNDRLTIVRFAADFCLACKATEPLFERFLRDSPHIDIVRVKVTKENRQDIHDLGVPSLPYGYVMHPDASADDNGERRVEELSLNKRHFADFVKVVQSYDDAECALPVQVDEETSVYESPFKRIG